MTSPLAEKNILLGITGGIAAYKVAGWARAMTGEGARVTTVMTRAATAFVAPLTFAALTRNRVYEDQFDAAVSAEIPHIALAKNSDLVLIAPATANTLARFAHGLADDLLSTVVLATEPRKVIVCPAMNCDMLNHPATLKNLATLRHFGFTVADPQAGSLACGDEGPGRLADWEAVRDILLARLTRQDLQGLTVMITAGPTNEPLDPVRFIGNRSSGRMGYALAATARRRGAEVILISGPTTMRPPAGVETIMVNTADEMHGAVMTNRSRAGVVVMTAAVADYRASEISSHKIKKGPGDWRLNLTANRDILRELGELGKTARCGPLLVGFAAETFNHLAEGERKLREKNLDLIAINDVTGPDSGFAAETNRVTLLSRTGERQDLPMLTKEDTAQRIWDRVLGLLSD